ncbi:hypothetical protein PtA15_8A95 [Puccinia triticina]|uniref:Uncharacterized protein n=1 Tax=Puccinia triticina TaxID=208348 RepID=A0ABY7CPL5_9BASI|nr:uncharacterized protein PtA15_8A95 [Puccinia triticina]WAQ87194.1 hypothetical protein PtA15_8A95 [Puccinia triticina]WAR57043.1 hypothetical protein PtB15_8B87 [Puccinia triticina]
MANHRSSCSAEPRCCRPIYKALSCPGPSFLPISSPPPSIALELLGSSRQSLKGHAIHFCPLIALPLFPPRHRLALSLSTQPARACSIAVSSAAYQLQGARRPGLPEESVWRVNHFAENYCVKTHSKLQGAFDSAQRGLQPFGPSETGVGVVGDIGEQHRPSTAVYQRLARADRYHDRQLVVVAVLSASAKRGYSLLLRFADAESTATIDRGSDLHRSVASIPDRGEQKEILPSSTTYAPISCPASRARPTALDGRYGSPISLYSDRDRITLTRAEGRR